MALNKLKFCVIPLVILKVSLRVTATLFPQLQVYHIHLSHRLRYNLLLLLLLLNSLNLAIILQLQLLSQQIQAHKAEREEQVELQLTKCRNTFVINKNFLLVKAKFPLIEMS